MLKLVIAGLHEQVTIVDQPKGKHANSTWQRRNAERNLAMLTMLQAIDEEILHQHSDAFTGPDGRRALDWYIRRWQDEMATQRAVEGERE